MTFFITSWPKLSIRGKVVAIWKTRLFHEVSSYSQIRQINALHMPTLPIEIQIFSLVRSNVFWFKFREKFLKNPTFCRNKNTIGDAKLRDPKARSKQNWLNISPGFVWILLHGHMTPTILQLYEGHVQHWRCFIPNFHQWTNGYIIHGNSLDASKLCSPKTNRWSLGGVFKTVLCRLPALRKTKTQSTCHPRPAFQDLSLENKLSAWQAAGKRQRI